MNSKLEESLVYSSDEILLCRNCGGSGVSSWLAHIAISVLSAGETPLLIVLCMT